MSAQANSIRSILYALSANFAIAIAKFVAAYFTKSGSMLAEAIHSLVDTSNQGLLLLGLKQAKEPDSEEHPLGQGKSIYFWSFIVALILFSLGGLFSIYEGLHKLQQPQPLSYPWVAVGVLVFAVVAEGLSLAGCIREVNKVRQGRSFRQWFRETRQSELLVVFGEDIAALLGLVFALVAVLLSIVTGDPLYDALGTIVIGALLVVVALLIGKEVKALLIGQGVEPLLRKQMLAILEQEASVAEVYNLITLQMGADVMVAVKARMQEQENSRQMIATINRLEKRFRSAFPQVKWLFFEPDDKD